MYIASGSYFCLQKKFRKLLPVPPPPIIVEVKQADSKKRGLSDRKAESCFLINELDSTLLNNFHFEFILPSIDVKQTDRVSCGLSNCLVLSLSC